MSYKDILVYVDNTARCPLRVALAGQIANTQQAHLVALNVRSPPLLPDFVAAEFGEEIVAIYHRTNAKAAAQARAMVESSGKLGPAVAIEWRDVEGEPIETVSLHARYSDITVIGQSEPDADSDRLLAEHLVLAVGRPLLVVPYAGKFPTIGQRVLVAWNGSREATRAIHDALPILAAAKAVHVVAVNPGGGAKGHGDVPGADISLHLSRHGISATCHNIASEELNVGQMLLSRAADEDVDLIVMGAYGRSRLSELVLGGVTHHMLRHMTVPVLMSH
jgi:nucleotide-binding universal stress UspA family protein